MNSDRAGRPNQKGNYVMKNCSPHVARRVGARPAGMAADCDITIGLVMELTGPAGEYGQAGAKSVEMAFRDFNDAGGVGGCKLVTDTRDSQSQGNVAVDRRRSWSRSRRCR